MKSNKILYLFIVVLFVALASCQKEDTDPVNEGIKQRASEIKFTFKVDGVEDKDGKLYSRYYIGSNKGLILESSYSNPTTKKRGSIYFNIADFKGVGTYLIDNSAFLANDFAEGTSSYLTFSHDEDTSISYRLDEDIASAVVKVTTYDTINHFVGGTFEAKNLKPGVVQLQHLSLTDGDFFVGLKTLFEVQGGE